MKIVFIANGILETGGLPAVSGGDIRFVEVGRRWRRAGVEIHVLSSQAGITLCRKLGLDAKFHVTDTTGGPATLAYVKRALKTHSEKELSKAIIYSTSDLLCDTFPALRLRRTLRSQWIATVHWIEELPWQRGLRLGPAWIDGLLLCLNQRFSTTLIRRFADAVLAVSNRTARQVEDLGIAGERIYSVKCGVDSELINNITPDCDRKNYDACYMKRFHPAKGIFDVIEIWERVCRQIKDAKLALVGHGPAHIITQVRKLVAQKNLDGNVDYLGVIYDVEKKIKVLKNSRLFIHPSYEENWAIVIGEAMACGLPVVAYELPVLRDIWKKGFVGVSVGDLEEFAGRVLDLLKDHQLYRKTSEEARHMASKYDWETVAKEELSILESLSHD